MFHSGFLMRYRPTLIMTHDIKHVHQISAILHIHDQFPMIVVVLIFTSNQVCANILENAKEVFQSKIDQAKKVIRGKSPGQVLFFCCCFFQVQKLYFNIFNIWTPQALQVLKRSSSSTSNSPLIVKKSCVIKSGLGRPNTDLILVNKAGRPVRESFTREKMISNVLR